MKRMTLTMLALCFIFSACCAGLAFAEPPEEANELWDNNQNYQAMLILYQLAQMNTYNLLDDNEFAALEKESDAALTESVKKSMAAGMDEVNAYAVAYGEQVLYLGRINTWKLIGDNPLEGFYELEDGTQAGYLAIYGNKEDNNYNLSIFVWNKAEPAKAGRCYAEASELKNTITTSSVQDLKVSMLDLKDPEDLDELEKLEHRTDPQLQLEISIEGGIATVKTTEAFKKNPLVYSGAEEDTMPINLVLDGKYVLKKK